jgi:hypothetical protein
MASGKLKHYILAQFRDNADKQKGICVKWREKGVG